jgi:GDPmannose 4,6-dehydratase
MLNLNQKKALIIGVSGQDGALLAKMLLSKGYHVCGTSRDAQITSFSNLKKLDIKEDVALESLSLMDFRSVLQVIKKYQPDEIYNLSGQSSVGLSFEQPIETFESIALGSLNLIEAIKFLSIPCRFYNASSSECFGETNDFGANETTPFHPKSPYGVAKAAAFWSVSNYRESYDIFACSGILFNHESSLRPSRFVTKKIIIEACKIAKTKKGNLSLGALDISRDWGWADEYIEAMWLMLQQEKPEDFVIATGNTYSLQDFVQMTFDYLGLDWKDWVLFDNKFRRPSDIVMSVANPLKAREKLGWTAKIKMPEVVERMINDCLINEKT